MVEELLSKSGAIGHQAAKAIADAAMLEVASTNAPHMVSARDVTMVWVRLYSDGTEFAPLSTLAFVGHLSGAG